MTHTKEEARKLVKDRVDQFAEELDELKTGVHVKEAQIEDKYIKPLWGALNWNVTGKGQIHRRQEFVVQGTIRSRKGTFVEPDYILRLPDSKGRMRDKLYIEAKLPKYPLIEMETTEVLKYVRQAYRYAHMKTAQSEDVDKWVRLSILTDFEEFLLFDCVDSAPLEKGNEHLLKKAIVEPFPWTFDRYVTDFDFLWDTFERNHVADGSLDLLKVTPQDRIKKRLPPDKRFLQDIERWRLELARSMWRLNRGNPNFNDDVLASATQLIIDRLVFVKMLSDKGIEPDYLSQMLSDLGKLGDSNVALFQECKSRFSFLNTLYNGAIFSERAELDAMPVENKVLIEILKELDPEYAPYTLASLDVRIIGNAYEQYLGKVIHADGRGVKIEKKPEVVKAKGVYYTPGFIVEYIVENTLGELLKNCKSPDDVSKLKILDPACGSGSFLLTAYDFILRWYQDYFVKERKVEKKYREFAEIIKLPDGAEVIRLTAKLRRDILLNNIYGVDIDPQAVEVAQFSLCMKALEGVEDRKELETERNLFKQTILPDMSGNIKCGNSLIGPDIYDEDLFGRLEPKEKRKINAFDWNREDKNSVNGNDIWVGIGNIVNSGGFDVVLGNPPWGAFFVEKELEYLRQRNQEIIVRMIDSFMYFVYASCKMLNTRGIFGMILPDVILYQSDNQKLRKYIVDNYGIKVVLNLGDVFDKVNRPTCILIFESNRNINQNIQIADMTKISKSKKSLEMSSSTQMEEIQQNNIGNTPGYLFLTSNVDKYIILDKINKQKCQCLEIYVDEDGIQRGVSPDLKEAFLVNSDTIDACKLEKHKLRKVLTGGKQVKRYFIKYPDLYLIYTRREDNFKELPHICTYIEQFKTQITCKEVAQGKHPLYGLHRAREEKLFLKRDKLLGVITEDEIVIAPDCENTFATDGLYLFGVREGVESTYIMGVLNSRLFVFIYRLLAIESGRPMAQVKPTLLAKLPIREIDFTKPAEKENHNKIVELVKRRLNLHKEMGKTVSQNDIDRIEGEIAYNEKSINKYVYQLYGLTDDEIKIVEGRE